MTLSSSMLSSISCNVVSYPLHTLAADEEDSFDTRKVGSKERIGMGKNMAHAMCANAILAISGKYRIRPDFFRFFYFLKR